MSLKDDLLRNRKVFDTLTGSQTSAYDSGADSPVTAKPYPPPVSETARTPEPLKLSDFEIEKPVTFSLVNGNRLSRETGMALNFSQADIGGIEFPELSPVISDNISSKTADPLESLYHRLEVEARRSSQLLGGEDY